MVSNRGHNGHLDYVDMYPVHVYTVYMSYHRIYIAKSVEDAFLIEPNKSGLLNDLLLKHYDKLPSSKDTRHYPRRYDYNDGLSSNGRIDGFEPSNLGSNPSEPAKVEVAPMALGYACCMSKTRRCKHWEFNEVDGYWQNTLNGEVVDA